MPQWRYAAEEDGCVECDSPSLEPSDSEDLMSNLVTRLLGCILSTLTHMASQKGKDQQATGQKDNTSLSTQTAKSEASGSRQEGWVIRWIDLISSS